MIFHDQVSHHRVSTTRSVWPNPVRVAALGGKGTAEGRQSLRSPMGEERSISLSFLIHASLGHAPCPAARSTYSFPSYPAMFITPLPEDCRPTSKAPRLQPSPAKGRSLLPRPSLVGAISSSTTSPQLNWASFALGWLLWVGRSLLLWLGWFGSVLGRLNRSVAVCRSLWVDRCGVGRFRLVAVGRSLSMIASGSVLWTQAQAPTSSRSECE